MKKSLREKRAVAAQKSSNYKCARTENITSVAEMSREPPTLKRKSNFSKVYKVVLKDFKSFCGDLYTLLRVLLIAFGTANFIFGFFGFVAFITNFVLFGHTDMGEENYYDYADLWFTTNSILVVSTTISFSIIGLFHMAKDYIRNVKRQVLEEDSAL